MSSTTSTNLVDSVTSTISNAASYVSETAKEFTSNASYEANKAEAKDSDLPIADRASSAFNAVGDKIEEKGHSAKADTHKETAKH